MGDVRAQSRDRSSAGLSAVADGAEGSPRHGLAIVEESQTAFHAIASSDVEPQFKEMAQHLYQQNHYDGTVIILMNEFVRAMQQEDPESMAVTYLIAMLAAADKARENLSLVANHRIRVAAMQ